MVLLRASARCSIGFAYITFHLEICLPSLAIILLLFNSHKNDSLLLGMDGQTVTLLERMNSLKTYAKIDD